MNKSQSSPALGPGPTMGTLPPDLAHIADDRLLNKILAKRQEEKRRRQCVFDVKARTIGLDTVALAEQIKEKRARQEAEKASEKQYSDIAILSDQIAMLCEQEKQTKAQERQRENSKYSMMHLRKENRREFALSDPDFLKKDRPARIGDDDPRCGPASVQKFAGEKVEADRSTNKKTYQNMQKQWLIEQMLEKEAVKQAERQNDAAYDEQVLMANHIRGVMENHMETTKRSNKKAESDYNVALAAEHRERKHDHIKREAVKSGTHVNTVMSMPMLHEAEGGPKGKTREEKLEIFEYNLLQMQHKRNVKRAEVEEEKLHAESVQDQMAALGAMEHRKAQLEVERRKLMDQENSVIAQAQRNMQKSLKATYTNHMSDDYFNVFNVNAR